MIAQHKLAFEIAKTQIGIKETAGRESTLRILEYHHATYLKATSDETAWCSAFVNWCFIQAGLLLSPSRMADLLKLKRFTLVEINQNFLPTTHKLAKELFSETRYNTFLDDWQSGPNKITMREGLLLPTFNSMARSWVLWGSEIKDPRKGDLVIFERGSDGLSGHVGFYVASDGIGPAEVLNRSEGLRVLTLGGNQNNQVCVAPYERSKLLSCRTT